MERSAEDDQDGADIEQFLNGFDYDDEEEERERVREEQQKERGYGFGYGGGGGRRGGGNAVEKAEKAEKMRTTQLNQTQSSSFIRQGCYAALNEICLSELRTLLTNLFCEIAPLTAHSGIDGDLSVWINHW